MAECVKHSRATAGCNLKHISCVLLNLRRRSESKLALRIDDHSGERCAPIFTLELIITDRPICGHPVEVATHVHLVFPKFPRRSCINVAVWIDADGTRICSFYRFGLG